MLVDRLPKISCIMAVEEDRDVGFALQCYASQTYPNKELVVLSRGPINATDGVIWFESGGTIGQMYNIAAEIAQGDIICQWSPNHTCHSCRLQFQYKALRQQTGAWGSYYSECLKIIDQKKVYWVKQDINESLMLWKRVFWESDSLFYLQENLVSDRLVPVMGCHYIHFGEVDGECYDRKHIFANKKYLEEMFSDLSIEELDVCYSNEIAFKYMRTHEI